MNKRRRFKAKRKRAVAREMREYQIPRRTLIEVSAADYEAIKQAIANPPAPNERLKALLSRPGFGFVSVD